MIFLEGESASSHSDNSSFMEEKLWSKLESNIDSAMLFWTS